MVCKFNHLSNSRWVLASHSCNRGPVLRTAIPIIMRIEVRPDLNVHTFGRCRHCVKKTARRGHHHLFRLETTPKRREY